MSFNPRAGVIGEDLAIKSVHTFFGVWSILVFLQLKGKEGQNTERLSVQKVLFSE